MYRIESFQFIESISVETIFVGEETSVLTKDKANICNVWRARRKL